MPILSKLKIRIRACGKRLSGTGAATEVNCYSEQEIQDLVLRQFPFDSSQFRMSLYVTTNYVSKPVEGVLYIETNFPENIEYVRMSVYEQGETPTTSDWNKVFYKDIDFDCIVDFCTLMFKSEDWTFEKQTDYYIQATIKVRTSELDYANPILNAIYFLETFQIGYKNKSLYLYNDSRELNQYKDYEKIPLILEIRDNLNLPSIDDLNLTLHVWDLGTTDFNGGGDAEATFEVISLFPNYYLYDQNTGMNKYAFLYRLREDSGHLESGHYYRAFVRIDDHTSKRQETIPVTISIKGETGGYDIDTNAFEQSNELTIQINNAANLSPPIMDQNGFHGFFCSQGQNRTAEEDMRTIPLYRELDLASQIVSVISYGFSHQVFRFGSSVVHDLISRDCHIFWVDQSYYADVMRIYIYNDYSDLTETDDKYKAYMDITIPTEKLIFNDGFDSIVSAINSAPQGCKNKYDADTIARAQCAVGSAFNLNLRDLADLGRDTINYWTEGTDMNTQQTINPKTRWISVKIEGLRPINIIDFEEAGIEFENIPQNKYFRYLIDNKGMEIFNDKKARIHIYQNNQEIDVIEVDNRLLARIIWAESIDQNGFYQARMSYNIRLDVCYNEGRNCLDPRTVSFTENVIVRKPTKPPELALWQCISSVENFSGCAMGFFTTPAVFITAFVFILLIFTGIFAYTIIKNRKQVG